MIDSLADVLRLVAVVLLAPFVLALFGLAMLLDQAFSWWLDRREARRARERHELVRRLIGGPPR